MNPTPDTPDEAVASASRRRWLFGGVAAAAAAVGAGWAWWRHQPGGLRDEAVAALWTLKFDQPAGGELAVAALRGKPLLVNFWATWCPPCVDELPLLDRFYKENAVKGWQVIGLAVDQPSAVRTFLQKMPISFPVGLAGLSGSDLSRSLGNLSGGLPFTVVLGSDGAVAQRKIGKVSEADLRQWASLA